MPTGYTSKLYYGKKKVSFKDFVMDCARAFGALVSLREDPNAEIPDKFEPSSYHVEELAKAKRKLAAASRWTYEDAARLSGAEYAKAIAYYRSQMVGRAALARRYGAMMKKVDAWVPPTKDHDGLKKFMTEQLSMSLRSDTYKPNRPRRIRASDFKAMAIHDATHYIAYHTEEMRKEVERAHERTAWVRALRESLAAK